MRALFGTHREHDESHRPVPLTAYQPPVREHHPASASEDRADEALSLLPKGSETSARLSRGIRDALLDSSGAPALHSHSQRATPSVLGRVSIGSTGTGAATAGGTAAGGMSVATSLCSTSVRHPGSAEHSVVMSFKGGAQSFQASTRSSSPPLTAPLPQPLKPTHRKVPSSSASDFSSSKLSLRGQQDTGAVRRVVVTAQEDEDDSNFCPTCLEAYTEENPKMYTACGHHYHLPCLYEWLERKDTCPICDTKINFDGMLDE